MKHEPQIAATQDKIYLKAITPLIFAAAIFFNTSCYAAYSDDDLKKLRALANKYLTAPVAEKEDEEGQHVDTEKAEDKKIESNDDLTLQDSVREAIPLWEIKSSSNRTWSEHVYNTLPTLGPDLLTSNPVDAKIFCPNYKNLGKSDRKRFWAFFISSMAKFESEFNPKSAFTEGFKDSTGRYVVSRGLLQISLESSKSYSCGFRTSADLHSANGNLSCGIRILNHWMKRDVRIASKYGGGWKGGARYWSVLRAGNKDSYKSIVKLSNSLPICKL